MRKLVRAAALALVLAPCAAHGVELRWGLLAGYNSDLGKNGLGARGEVVAARLFQSAPLGVSFGLGYTRIDPGDARAARRVFINNNTDGTPEKDGYFLDFKLDAIWYLQAKGFQNVGVFGGVRRDMFRGHFRYVGGNEDFVVKADDWGLGVGGRGELKIGRGINLLGSAGLDLYPASKLDGHDATYASNGGNTNTRDDYGWKDADKAINQPRLLWSLMVGIAF